MTTSTTVCHSLARLPSAPRTGMSQAMLASTSDCLTHSWQVNFGDVWVPEMAIVRVGHPTVKLDMPYQLVELNNRTDFCVNTSGLVCDGMVLSFGCSLTSGHLNIV
jgi:hypothetical protein